MPRSRVPKNTRGLTPTAWEQFCTAFFLMCVLHIIKPYGKKLMCVLHIIKSYNKKAVRRVHPEGESVDSMTLLIRVLSSIKYFGGMFPHVRSIVFALMRRLMPSPLSFVLSL